MLDGKELRLQRLKAVEGRAIQHQNVSLCLSVYRDLVAHTTEQLVPHLEKFADTSAKAMGRPSKNSVIKPYIREIGIRKTLAIAVSTVVNNFHRPQTFQAMSVLVGNALAFEWQIMQEDQDTVQRICDYMHTGSGTQRKKVYLRQTIKLIQQSALSKLSTQFRASLGGELLALIGRTSLIEITKNTKHGIYNVVATPSLLEMLEERLDDEAERTAVLLPSEVPDLVSNDLLVKPQRGFRNDGSHIPRNDSNLTVAAKILNNTKWSVNPVQYNFVKECAKSRAGLLGLPPSVDPEFPTYREDMTEEERLETRRAIARMHTERNISRTQRTRLLSTLHLVSNYVDKPCYFGVSLDFRGRIYTASEHLSYQGPDWLRSLWQFHDKLPIETATQRDWLYIHTANCYGLSRLSFDARLDHIDSHMDKICATAMDPWGNLEYLRTAKDPFKFFAACIEVEKFSRVKYGMLSGLPIQMDASSQGIQIWSTICGDKELMEASNVVPSKDGQPRDIYTEIANDINSEARVTDHNSAVYFRLNPVERSVVKRGVMIIPYGGSYPAIQKVVDSHLTEAPVGSRAWLTGRIWAYSGDRLDTLIKASHRLSSAAREALKDGSLEHLEWDAPSGMRVKQKYMKDKRIRIKNSIGQMIHSYREETDELDIGKNAAAFPPNLIHSLDASILSSFIVNSNKNNNIKDYLVIHDCVGVHAANAHAAHTTLGLSFTDVLTSNFIKSLFSEPLDRAWEGVYNASLLTGEVRNTSPYLFS